MSNEAMYQDGSISTFTEGGSFHSGDLAMERLRLITSRSALQIHLKYDGRMELTRGGAQMAIKNVIEPLTGKTYKRSKNGKAEALNDCIELLAQIEDNAVIYTEEVSA